MARLLVRTDDTGIRCSTETKRRVKAKADMSGMRMYEATELALKQWLDGSAKEHNVPPEYAPMVEKFDRLLASGHRQAIETISRHLDLFDQVFVKQPKPRRAAPRADAK